MGIFRRFRYSFIPIAVMLIIGCVSVPHGQLGNYSGSLWSMDEYPLNVFLGVSAPYADKEKMVAEAMFNCARSIAISELLQVTSSLVSETSSSEGLFSFATEGKASYFDGEVLAILDRLVLVEVRPAGRQGLVILAMDPMIGSVQRPFIQSFDSAGKPRWVDNVPEIPGYIVAVGETLGYQYLRDSLEAADVAAAEALLDRSLSVVTHAKSYSLHITSADTYSSSSYFQDGVLQINDANLVGFHVLARWHDAAANRYYALAIAEK